MNLFTFGERPEDRDGDHWPYSAFRWAFRVEWCAAGFVWECRDKKTGKWIETDHTFEVMLSSPSAIGIRHAYYDGPHCSLALGWLYILWSGDPRTGWCEKCMPSERAADQDAGVN